MKKQILLSIALMGSLISQGCGNKVRGTKESLIPLSSTKSNIVNVDDPSAEKYYLNEYYCPVGQQVTPDYDAYLDGSGNFKICQSAVTTDKILVQGKLHDTSVAAVFPAKYIDQNQVWYKPEIGKDPARPSTEPYMRKVSLNSLTSGLFSIENADYNSVFIVADYDAEKMKECLIKGNYQLCPNYSFGKFR